MYTRAVFLRSDQHTAFVGALLASTTAFALQGQRSSWEAALCRTGMWKHDRFQDQMVAAFTLLLLAAGWGFQSAAGVTLGVNYGMTANDLPAPSEVVRLLQSISVTKSKLYDADPLVLQTFGNTGISFIVGTYNQDLLSLTNPAAAVTWVQTNIVAHVPATQITGIVVGNEIFTGTDTTMMSQVLPAMKNVYAALEAVGLQRQIFVSTAHSFSVLSASFPPSAGVFNPAIANLYIKPILDFLVQTNAPFLINVYPFFAYEADPSQVSLQYVLFESSTGVVDNGTGLHYYNMFDAQMDAVYSAISALGYENVTLLVSETGWPSLGDADEPGATVANAQKYHENLIQHVMSKQGTPLRPDTTPEVYLFALFNEDLKPGPTSERNYGLFRPDGTMVYQISFSQASSAAACLRYPTFTVAFIAIVMYFYCMSTSILTNSYGF